MRRTKDRAPSRTLGLSDIYDQHGLPTKKSLTTRCTGQIDGPKQPDLGQHRTTEKTIWHVELLSPHDGMVTTRAGT